MEVEHKVMRLTDKQKKKLLAVAILLAVVAISVIAYVHIGAPMTQMVKNVEDFQRWVVQNGWKSRLVFIGMVCFQVIVAIIPGEPLEMAAGFVFRAFEGTILTIIGVVLGSVIVFGLVRRFGVKLVQVFFSKEKIASLRIGRSQKRMFFVIAVLMLLPGTPKDLLTYCAGLTRIPFTAWLLLSSVGRLPSVVTSTVCGDAISQGNYWMAVIVFIGTMLLCGTGLLLYAKMKNPAKEEKTEGIH